jgi:hypothetical protein
VEAELVLDGEHRAARRDASDQGKARFFLDADAARETVRELDRAFAFERREMLEDPDGGSEPEGFRELGARRRPSMLGEVAANGFEDLELPRGELFLHG